MTKLKAQSVEDGEVRKQQSMRERIDHIRDTLQGGRLRESLPQDSSLPESREDPGLATIVAEIKKDIAADTKSHQKESFVREQETLALRNEISNLQNANAILTYKIDAIVKKSVDSKVSEFKVAAQQDEDTSINKVVKAKLTEKDTSRKNAKAYQDDDGDFDGDSEEYRTVNDGEDIHQAQYDTLKELIEKNQDELYTSIGDNKKFIMAKLATKFQKKLDLIAGDLAEHVVEVAELRESGNLISVQELRQQIGELKQQIEQGRKTASNVEVETPHLNRREQGSQEKTRFANTVKPITADDFKALRQELYEKLKLFTGEVGKELKRMNTKLGGPAVNSAKGDEVVAYLANVEAKIDNVHEWVMTVNQNLVDSGKANLVGHQY